ncbi:MAG: ankyrin repeat domain-containing protein [Pseudomonadota bacterium]|nr:ankyrin repeat domain-containing protein [Pseudomonadota bacterium]
MVKRIIMDIDRRRQLAGNSGNFPLPLRFAIKNNSIESTPFLLEIIGVNNLSKTIMHEAVKSGNLLMVKLLLNEGVSPNNKDSSGCLPISYVPKDREDMVQLLSGKPLADIVPKKSALQSKNAIFDSKNIKKLRDVFSLYGKGANRSDLWMRRGVFILLAISISSFAAAFFYPINLLLNVAMIACYSAVILESYVSNICLPNSPKITEVMLDNTMLGVQRDEGAKVNSALLFPFISDNTNNAKSSEIINSVSSNDNDIKLLDKENFAPDNLVALDSTVRV